MPNPSERLANGKFPGKNTLQMSVNVDICSLCKRVRKTRLHTCGTVRTKVCEECRSKL